MKKAKILFTAPWGRYPKLPVEKDPLDYFYYRNTYKQKMFQLRAFQSWHSLHFLAQNIPLPSVVLENASVKRFRNEMHKGKYEVVAIGFTTILLNKRVLDMVKWIKEEYPATEIVIGGYGTAVFKESLKTSDEIKALVDEICFEDGVEFMHKIIERKWGIRKNISLSQDLIPAVNSFYRSRINLFKQIVVVGGLGCVSGCPFCATSAQFNHKYISLFTGKQLVQTLLEQTKKYTSANTAIIYEEDFLKNREKVLEFMNAYHNSDLRNKSILITVFASLRSIQQYSIEELIKCGIGTVFIGVESFKDRIILQEKLGKRKGGVKEKFEELHCHGISSLGSLIIGFDSQSLSDAEEDSKAFAELNPTLYQVVPLHVVPGTSLWEKMKKEGRIHENYEAESDGISSYNFKAKSFPHDIALELVFKTYSGLVSEGGPWPFRFFENFLKGYLNLKDHKNEIFRQRALIYRSLMFPMCLLAFASRFLFFGVGFRNRWNATMRIFMKEIPGLFLLSAILSPLIWIYLILVYVFSNLWYKLNPLGDQPNFIRKTYPGRN